MQQCASRVRQLHVPASCLRDGADLERLISTLAGLEAEALEHCSLDLFDNPDAKDIPLSLFTGKAGSRLRSLCLNPAMSFPTTSLPNLTRLLLCESAWEHCMAVSVHTPNPVQHPMCNIWALLGFLAKTPKLETLSLHCQLVSTQDVSPPTSRPRLKELRCFDYGAPAWTTNEAGPLSTLLTEIVLPARCHVHLAGNMSGEQPNAFSQPSSSSCPVAARIRQVCTSVSPSR
ncbi:hypothetical protein L227DRAFT_100851 [Lentinus tigrinus ALCF2SS1-6]|uniref:F-box domain-containing protein n=1 Tax=Lentinus tigrinus ALCF2SS1-6 TaxID=1328759 RepID=A0A5C2SAU9_9APHY|nr:hypothetical protein L227DRAFT_100851 [Lentinus tigrinus ALCF2SS1-6]